MAVRSRLVSATGAARTAAASGVAKVGFDPAGVHLEAISPTKSGWSMTARWKGSTEATPSI